MDTAKAAQIQPAPMVRILELQADAFYGLRHWDEALKACRQALILRASDERAMQRAAECLYAMGLKNEAAEAAGHLAQRYESRGNRSLQKGELETAFGLYQNAVQILAWILQYDPGTEPVKEAETCHENLGNILMLTRQSAAAVAHFGRAVQFWSGLAGTGGQSGLAAELANSQI